jgi:hypothetical protein
MCTHTHTHTHTHTNTPLNKDYNACKLLRIKITPTVKRKIMGFKFKAHDESELLLKNKATLKPTLKQEDVFQKRLRVSAEFCSALMT